MTTALPKLLRDAERLVASIAHAVSAESVGGKKVTATEWAEIGAAALALARDVLAVAAAR